MWANRRTPWRAFTLLELLAAVALLVILGTLLFQIFGQASHVMRLGTGRQEIYQYVRALFDTLERELAGTLGQRDAALAETGRPFRVYTTDAGLQAFGLPVRGGTDALSFTAALVGRDTIEGSVTYGQTGNAAHVAYWVSPDGFVLNRYESYDLATSATGRGWEFALHVLEFQIRCLDMTVTPPRFQRTDWDSTSAPGGVRRGLPAAVMITVKITDKTHIRVWRFDAGSKSSVLRDGHTADDDPMVQEFQQIIRLVEEL